MTQTIQLRSLALLNDVELNTNITKPETEDNRNLLLSVFDSMNTLCEKLSKLEYLIKRKHIEQILYYKKQGVN